MNILEYSNIYKNPRSPPNAGVCNIAQVQDAASLIYLHSTTRDDIRSPHFRRGRQICKQGGRGFGSHQHHEEESVRLHRFFSTFAVVLLR